jgi:hypothetical protein
LLGGFTVKFLAAPALALALTGFSRMRLSQARAVLRHSRELAEAVRERGCGNRRGFPSYSLTPPRCRRLREFGRNSPRSVSSAPGHVALAIAVGVAPLRAAKINVEALID